MDRFGLSLELLRGQNGCYQVLSNVIIADRSKDAVVQLVFQVGVKPDVGKLVEGDVVEH